MLSACANNTRAPRTVALSSCNSLAALTALPQQHFSALKIMLHRLYPGSGIVCAIPGQETCCGLDSLGFQPALNPVLVLPQPRSGLICVLPWPCSSHFTDPLQPCIHLLTLDYAKLASTFGLHLDSNYNIDLACLQTLTLVVTHGLTPVLLFPFSWSLSYIWLQLLLQPPGLTTWN